MPFLKKRKLTSRIHIFFNKLAKKASNSFCFS